MVYVTFNLNLLYIVGLNCAIKLEDRSYFFLSWSDLLLEQLPIRSAGIPHSTALFKTQAIRSVAKQSCTYVIFKPRNKLVLFITCALVLNFKSSVTHYICYTLRIDDVYCIHTSSAQDPFNFDADPDPDPDPGH